MRFSLLRRQGTRKNPKIRLQIPPLKKGVRGILICFADIVCFILLRRQGNQAVTTLAPQVQIKSDYACALLREHANFLSERA